MSYRKSLDFLPQVFQTETNNKILKGTLDQLVSEPQLRRMDGFIGRKYNPALTPSDSYLIEDFADRQEYQLEPSVVIYDEDGRVDHLSTYQDLLTRIDALGGDTSDPSRLFAAEQYNFGSLLDYDKFVNYSSYYWLPNGPDSVDVFATEIPTNLSIDVTSPTQFGVADGLFDSELFSSIAFDISEFGATRLKPTGYTFSNTGDLQNPVLRLARGGVYEFKVNQKGHGFYIQTTPGTTNSYSWQANLSIRDVLGVENNGEDVGTVTFRVPTKDAQDEFVNMPIQDQIDLVGFSLRKNRFLRYKEVQNAEYSILIQEHLGIDGQRFLEGKTVLFVEADESVPVEWRPATPYVEGDLIRFSNVVYRALRAFTSGTQFTSGNLEIYDDEDNWYDPILFDSTPYDSTNFERGADVPIEQRLGWFRININSEGRIELTPVDSISRNNKVDIKEGVNYGNRQVYRASTDSLEIVDPLTATFDYLYYQDALDPTMNGLIELVDQVEQFIDVDIIMGAVDYISPNGVRFENGLKVKFGEETIPAEYAGETFYVEGVGESIELIPVDNLITPEPWLDTVSAPFDSEPYDTLGFDQAQPAPIQKQYITIKRNSQECSYWTRQNRWFHEDVITNTNDYNNFIGDLDQTARAKRPVIEFEPNLQLFDFGSQYLAGVSVVDTEELDAFTNVEGQAVDSTAGQSGYFSDGVPLSPGYYVVFTQDTDPNVRNTIWLVEWITPQSEDSDVTVSFTGDGATTEFELGFEVTDTIRLNVDIDGVDAADSGALWSLIGTQVVFAVAPDDASDITIRYQYDKQLHLVPHKTAEEGDTVLSILGNNNQGTQWQYTNGAWDQCQIKLQDNQNPLFELYDRQQVNLGDTTKYPSTNYAGNTVFQYKIGNGVVDSELGIRLSYRSINNVGDILFDNTLGATVYNYELDETTVSISSDGTLLKENLKDGTSRYVNQWATSQTKKTQRQVETFFATQYQTNLFKLNEYPDELVAANIQVYVNNVPVMLAGYDIEVIGGIGYLNFNTDLEDGDKIDVFTYTDKKNDFSFWEVPSNLENNALNETVGEITLGQLRFHMINAMVQTTDLEGEIQGANNLKDIPNEHNAPGKIVQNAGAPHLAAFFLNDDKANFIDSIEYAQREYERFKNKFNQLAYELPLRDPQDPVRSVDEILTDYVCNKSDMFPFYNSDMVPFGNDYTSTKYTVVDDAINSYFLTRTYDETKPGNTGVLVYLNGVLLTKGRQYTFSPDSPVITIQTAPDNASLFSEYVTLAIGDEIEIREYDNTDGTCIPPTPAKLGIFPPCEPLIMKEETENEDVEVIRGHDGSFMVRYGDYRDDIILELEKRIYNNIKGGYKSELFDMIAKMPGAFRDTEYTKPEFDRALSSSFNTWMGANGASLDGNEFFDSNDAFTWNYTRFGSRLTGEPFEAAYWRGMYLYYYDTDQPNIRPWEMLGFTEEPEWWRQEYGPAPYTSGNLLLWSDLEQGVIRQGDRQGTDVRYARPGLNSIIPVDDSGELLSPVQAIAGTSSTDVEGSFRFGDVGPVETAWRKSSEYFFAIVKAMALLYPAEFFGLLRDTVDQIKLNPGDVEREQWIFDSNGTRRDVEYLAGEIVNGELVRKNGYSTWIAEYAKYKGLSVTEDVADRMRSIELKLSYKMGGYTDKKYLKIFADQASPNSLNSSVIVPDEDYDVTLTKSSPTSRVTYSGVIVTRTGTGYSVTGYDTNKPFFEAELPSANAKKRLVRVGTEGYEVALQGSGTVVTVPYGTEFLSKQEVLDFLVGYGRRLTTQGFRFEDKDDEDASYKRDWWLSAQQFLLWSQQGWEDGISITLSPIGDRAVFRSLRGAVDRISNSFDGSRVLNSNFEVLRDSQYTTDRDGREFVLHTTNGDGIYLLDLRVVDYEHTLVFNNITEFNDIIYQPELGNRQFRLRITGFKSAAWDGSFGAPGFIINDVFTPEWSKSKNYSKGEIVLRKQRYYVATTDVSANIDFENQSWEPTEYGDIDSTLLPNLAARAGAYKDFYDFNQSNLELDVDRLAKGAIGFNPRDYLTDLGINDTSQVNFYKGSLSQKGSNQSLDKMLRAKLDNFDGAANFYEQWAIRSGVYGSSDNTRQVKVALKSDKVFQDPAVIEFLNTNDEAKSGRVSIRPNEVLEAPRQWDKNFLTHRDKKAEVHDLPTAGYARQDDVRFLSFDSANVSATLRGQNVVDGDAVWIANNTDNDWGVYRVTDVDILIDTVSVDSTGFAEVSTETAHNLAVDDDVYVRDFANRGFDGYFTVAQVLDANTFRMQTNFNPVVESDVDARLYKMTNLRITDVDAVENITPMDGWKTNDHLFVDEFSTDGWGVYKFESVYNDFTVYLDSEATTNDLLGSSIAVNPTEDAMLVGAPGAEKVQTYKLVNSILTEDVDLSSPSSTTQGFGTTLAFSDNDFAVIGSPLSNTGIGHVHVARQDAVDSFFIEQVITPEGLTPNSEFGASVAISDDARWLFVGAPGEAQGFVYAYQKIDNDTEFEQVIETNGIADTYALESEAASLNNVYGLKVVGVDGSLLVPFEDYTLSGSDIVFTTPPALGDISITLKTFYSLLTSFSYSTTVGDRFGEQIALNEDGSQLIVSAPGYDNSTIDTGRVFVIDRTIEKRYANGTSTIFSTTLQVFGVPEVKLNDVVQDPALYTFDGFTNITFSTPPSAGSIVSIESNNPVNSLVLDGTDVASDTSLRFGESLAVCDTSCGLYVGAPSSDYETTDSGAVYSWINQGRFYGEITGTITSPTVSQDSFVSINGFIILFETGDDLERVAQKINAADIPGVDALTIGDKLKIESDSIIFADKLNLVLLNGDFFNDMGLEVYVFQQTITAPRPASFERFGVSLAVNRDSTQLAVGTTRGNTEVVTVIDTNETLFDRDTTRFKSFKESSGAVYMYQLLPKISPTVDSPSKYVFTEKLAPGDLDQFDDFGIAMEFSTDTIFVGAPSNDLENIGNRGVVFASNNGGTGAWSIKRQQTPKVDLSLINQCFLYNRETGEKLADLDVIDPAKGRISGTAAQEIKYQIGYDPAVYSADGGGSIWKSEHKGELWWNITNVKWIEYEQDSLEYRASNWGFAFPGSNVTCYEWVESTVPPANYSVTDNPAARPLNTTDFNTSTRFDSVSGKTTTLYYFWVSGLKQTPVGNPNRRISASQVEELISNPRFNDLPHVSFLASNAISLHNVLPLISSDDVVLVVDYDVTFNNASIHSEYELLNEGDPRSLPSDRVYTKLVDSIAGIDAQGNNVPDPMLSEDMQLGIEFRPRQSMFPDRTSALRDAIDYLNRFLLTIPAIYEFDTSEIFARDPEPIEFEYNERVLSRTELDYLDVNTFADGYLILVAVDETTRNRWVLYEMVNNEWFKKKVQNFNNARYLETVNWDAPGVEVSTVTDRVVDFTFELEQLVGVQNGEFVKVRNSGGGLSRIVLRENDEWVTVQEEAGTFQIRDSIWDISLNSQGFDADGFDLQLFDDWPGTEIRLIFNALRNSVFINEYTDQLNGWVVHMLKVALSQNPTLDWVFKTSLITVDQKQRAIDQIPVYQQENQDLLERYILDIKPYHTKISEYTISYSGNEEIDGKVTDFDLPAYYSFENNAYRSPTGTSPEDVFVLSQEPYVDWRDNYTLEIGSVTINNGGTGYVLPPQLSVVGGGGTGAEVRAVVASGTIVGVVVESAGTGYTTTPEIVVSDEYGIDASLTAVMQNLKVRRISDTIKFDRTANNQGWLITFLDFFGDPVDVRNEFISRMNTEFGVLDSVMDLITLGDWIESDPVQVVFPVDNAVDFRIFDDTSGRVEFFMKRDTVGWTPALLETFIRSLGFFVGINSLDISGSTVEEFGSYMDFNESYLPWIAGYTYQPGDLIVNNRIAYTADVQFVAASSTFDSSNLTQLDQSALTAIDRINAFYQPNNGDFGLDIKQVMSGVGYDANKVSGPTFDQNPGFDVGNFDTKPFDSVIIGPEGVPVIDPEILDQTLQGSFLDTALGTRPADIITSGGGFVDAQLGAGPEEHVAGTMYDTLDMKVYSLSTPESVAEGASPKVTTIRYRGDDSTTTFSYGDEALSGDYFIVYSKDLGAFYRDPTQSGEVVNPTIPGSYAETAMSDRTYTVDYINRTITLAQPITENDVLSIINYGQIGRKLLLNRTFIAEGSTAAFDLPVPIEDVFDAMVLINGVEVQNYQFFEVNEFTTQLAFDVIPEDGDWVRIVISGDPDFNSISRVNQQLEIVNDSSREITLDKNLRYDRSKDSTVIVELNGSRLRPGNSEYYIGDGSTSIFELPSSAMETYNSLTFAEVQVWKNGIRQDSSEYSLSTLDGSSIPVITFFDAPASGDDISITYTADAQYFYSTDNTLRILESIPIADDSLLSVISFSDHDSYKIKTKVFIGTDQLVTTAAVIPGFDSLGFDSVAFDSTTSVTLLKLEYEIDADQNDASKLSVSIDGVRQVPNFDYTLVAGIIIFADTKNIDDTTEIVVTWFSATDYVFSVSWQIFKDMRENTEIRRLSFFETTTLAAKLAIDDETITVTDASVLDEPDAQAGRPGVVFINGERIEYYTKTGNVLGQLLRGTRGTSNPGAHIVDSQVINGGPSAIIPNAQATTWYDRGEFTAANGRSLIEADTTQARFLKEKQGLVPTGEVYSVELFGDRFIELGYTETDYVSSQPTID